MGLLSSFKDQAETVQRRAETQAALTNRTVRAQNKAAGEMQAQVAPHMQIVDQFNKDLEAYQAGFVGGIDNPTQFKQVYMEDGHVAYVPANVAYDENGAGPVPDPMTGMHFVNQVSGGSPQNGGGIIGNLNSVPTPDRTKAMASNDILTQMTPGVEALNAKSAQVQKRAGLMGNKIEREADRLNFDIELNRGKIAQEQDPAAPSVFDKVQSISDWLK